MGDEHEAQTETQCFGAVRYHFVLDAVYAASHLYRFCGLAHRVSKSGKKLFVSHRLGLAQLCGCVHPCGHEQLFAGDLYLRDHGFAAQCGVGHLCGLCPQQIPFSGKSLLHLYHFCYAGAASGGHCSAGIYDDAENGPLQHLYGCNSHHFGHQHGVSHSADAQLL